jgi:hypothetical protein
MWMSFVTDSPDDVETWHFYLGEHGGDGAPGPARKWCTKGSTAADGEL